MSTVHTVRMTRPDDKETEYFWKLYHAAQRNDARWHGSELHYIAEELSSTDLSRNQKIFLLRAWQVLVDDAGGFGRFMGAFDTYVYNLQDPEDDCVAWKPEIKQLFGDAELLPVVLEAYQQAQELINELEASEPRYDFDEPALKIAQKIMECQATAAVDGWPDGRLKAAIQCLVIEAMKWAAPESGWTEDINANSAIVMLDRINTIDSDDDCRIEEVKNIIRRMAVAPAAGGNDA